jgi:hypothetical protein
MVRAWGVFSPGPLGVPRESTVPVEGRIQNLTRDKNNVQHVCPVHIHESMPSIYAKFEAACVLPVIFIFWQETNMKEKLTLSW